jgi:hypothetical protein
MAIMLKIRWDIKESKEQDFRKNQEKLCAVMSNDHPGVICYHVDYPEPGVCESVEIYANNSAFKARLDNQMGKEPFAALVGACGKITCKCWGDPTEESKKILARFGATYHETAKASFLLHPNAHAASPV